MADRNSEALPPPPPPPFYLPNDGNALEGVSSPRGVRRRPPPWRGHTPGGEDVVLPARCVAAKPLYGIPHTVRGGGGPPRAVCEVPDVDCTFICTYVCSY